MKTYTSEELKEILELHKKWIHNNKGGARANLSSANLSYANLSDANLSSANLSDANLSDADLSYANLSDADLSYANLSDADLSSANLSSANLRYANLSSANLSYANLSDANLSSANLSDANLSDADLRYVIGEMKYIKSLQCEKYYISYTYKKLNIGCQEHLIEEWKNFDDKKIKSMDSGALEWWVKWKQIILQIIEMSPCKPHKGEE